ncbi:MAG: polysaccharide deacetylase family protein [Bacteroidetes bacterium]|nr:polysaccharide deacetylase family protein [Bacteroidota bacterium]MCX7906556.1 polysaccharide deacetylase family protein [Bacteroidota bacterium]MDW8137163.1 polysaccharide deacetylase family protein [Bacteroidota bacterium]
MPTTWASLPVHLDVPAAFEPKALLGLEALLLPLGLRPVRARPDQGRRGLYYGPEEPDWEAGLCIRARPETWAYFERLAPYPTEWLCYWERVPVLFGLPVARLAGEVWYTELDLIASAFFWVSGWQEYASPERDQHGRFPYRASLQARMGWVERPLVNEYARLLGSWLDSVGLSAPGLRWRGCGWALVLSHDIDYLRKWRPGMIYRELIWHFLQNRRRLRWSDRIGRLRAFLRDWLRAGDVMRESLERIWALERSWGVRATYFFKTGARDKRDVGYSHRSRYLKGLIAGLLREGFEVGLHPSYRAHDRADYMRQERDRLLRLLQRSEPRAELRAVRQHFLRLALPETFRIQVALGFAWDATLGFAEREGFRRACATPFRIFDVPANRILPLWEFPLLLMDSTLFDYRKLSAQEALESTLRLYEITRSAGGVAVSLWHNVLYDPLDYPGWGEVFERSTLWAIAHGAFVGSLAEVAAELEGWP